MEGPIPELPEALNRAAPALAQILKRCLAKRPEHRPVSAKALAEALREVAAETAASFPPGALERFWQELAHRPRVVPPQRGPLAETHVRTVSVKVYPAGLPAAAAQS